MHAKGMILDRYYAQLAEGVQRFAVPVPVAVPAAVVLEDGPCAPCATCPRRGAVARASGAFVNANPADVREWRTCVAHWERNPLFVLSDVPSPEDEACEGPLFSAEKSSAAVLCRLLDKLPQGHLAHRSFAQKCFSRKGPLGGDDSVCAREVLSRELARVQPEVVLCFGHRALLGLGEGFQASKEALAELLAACQKGHACEFHAAWGTVAVVVLPSALELERFPEWRAGVWERLAFLRERVR